MRHREYLNEVTPFGDEDHGEVGGDNPWSHVAETGTPCGGRAGPTCHCHVRPDSPPLNSTKAELAAGTTQDGHPSVCTGVLTLTRVPLPEPVAVPPALPALAPLGLACTGALTLTRVPLPAPVVVPPPLTAGSPTVSQQGCDSQPGEHAIAAG